MKKIILIMFVTICSVVIGLEVNYNIELTRTHVSKYGNLYENNPALFSVELNHIFNFGIMNNSFNNIGGIISVNKYFDNCFILGIGIASGYKKSYDVKRHRTHYVISTYSNGKYTPLLYVGYKIGRYKILCYGRCLSVVYEME